MRLSTMTLHGVSRIEVSRFEGLFSKAIRLDIFGKDHNEPDTIYIYGNEGSNRQPVGLTITDEIKEKP